MLDNLQILKNLVSNKFKESDFFDDLRYKKRLQFELIEIETQNCAEYFLDIQKSGKKYPNENNLLVPFLLGICDDFDINRMCVTKTNEFPDVDIDFLATVRDYLKNEFALKEYKAQNTCSIGTYGRYALKSALLDMARIYGLDRHEALNITTSLRLRDEDGDIMTYEEALENFPELKTYLDKYPQVAIAIQKLINRVRTTGKHAGGVIICNDEINKFVPLMKTTGGDNLVSQYVEGLATQELGPIGLVKFDLLVVSALEQLGIAARMIKERHNIKVIAGVEEDWDQTDYLNDPKCIEVADKADLLGVFQYDSDGIREVVKKAGINSFDDLVAIVSLYRPGPLNMKMDELFIKRKRQIETYENHPLLEPIIGSTYGILIYQEQVMKMLHVVGKIPLKDCETIRKAISKKKISSFIKYKEMFIENGMVTLDKSKEEISKLFDLIEAFSAYGFNLSHATAYTYISSRGLYLKTYYPIEFYTSLLMLERSEEKIRIYISDAEAHGIEVCPLDINKSKENFSIQDGKIYIGFGNIKGVGEDRAKEIVALQPFVDFEDFITRFGTDANVLRALIPLNVFKDSSPEEQYKFWQYYTSFAKKGNEREKRYAKTQQTIREEMIKLLPAKYQKIDLSDQSVYDSFIESMKDNEDIQKLHKKMLRSKSGFESKTMDMPSMIGFDPDLCKIEDKEVLKQLKDIIISENLYYGFQFTNRVRNCANYNPEATFENLLNNFKNPKSVKFVQIDILDVSMRSMKNGGKYCQLTAMDSKFKVERINIWEEDTAIFKNLFKKGNLLSIHLMVPSGGFASYSLLTPPKHKRYLLPKDPSLDVRVVLLN